MSNLVPYKPATVTKIVQESLAEAPVAYRDGLKDSFTYLAFCFTQDSDKRHLQDIQIMLRSAQEQDERALRDMRSHLQGEMRQMRGEMLVAFQGIAQHLKSVDSRLGNVEARLEEVESRSPQQVDNRRYYFVRNECHSSNSANSLMILLTALALAGTMLAVQTQNVRDTWRQLDQNRHGRIQ